MYYPEPLKSSKKRDPKLQIGSSLANPKALLAQTILLYLSNNQPSTITPMSDVGQYALQLNSATESTLREYLANEAGYNEQQLDELIDRFNRGPLMEKQFEPLSVALELVWGLCELGFQDDTKMRSGERNGGVRYPKILNFTSNMDLLYSVCQSAPSPYITVLIGWLQNTTNYDLDAEHRIKTVLSVLAQHSLYKIHTSEGVLTFDIEGLYDAVSQHPDGVSIDSTREHKGPVRILKSSLASDVWAMLEVEDRHTVLPRSGVDLQSIRNFKERLARHRLIYNVRPQVAGATDLSPEEDDSSVLEVGLSNIILYGVPGAGKSHAVESVVKSGTDFMERTVFHPDYSYSDFTVQILPGMNGDQVTYNQIPGPFARVLKRASDDPGHDYFLVIEEINRGNAPAIFGDLFQLLDRNERGWSTYTVASSQLAEFVYGNSTMPIRIPPNMKIVATMNTADQNVFTLDTAFQRRWSMQMIDNDFTRSPYALNPILDTSVTWRKFCEVFNQRILEHGMYEHSTSDKRMGVFFVSAVELGFPAQANSIDGFSSFNRVPFCDKVLKYLWDDAFKFNRSEIFRDSAGKSFEDIAYDFSTSIDDDRFAVFEESIVDSLLN